MSAIHSIHQSRDRTEGLFLLPQGSMEEEMSKLTVGAKTTRTRHVKAPTLHVLVQFLSAERPLSAFDIRTSLGPALSKGTIYPMLARLEQKGWLSGEQVAGLRVPKRVYQLTRIGAREARALARQHARMAGGHWIIDEAGSARDGAQVKDRPPGNWCSGADAARRQPPQRTTLA